jgi:hypothetical protein
LARGGFAIGFSFVAVECSFDRDQGIDRPAAGTLLHARDGASGQAGTARELAQGQRPAIDLVEDALDGLCHGCHGHTLPG